MQRPVLGVDDLDTELMRFEARAGIVKREIVAGRHAAATSVSNGKIDLPAAAVGADPDVVDGELNVTLDEGFASGARERDDRAGRGGEPSLGAGLRRARS